MDIGIEFVDLTDTHGIRHDTIDDVRDNGTKNVLDVIDLIAERDRIHSPRYLMRLE